MTTTSREPVAPPKDETVIRTGWATQILIPEMWGTLAIGMMWLAVILVAASDLNITISNTPTNQTIIPASVFVALFAFLGTTAVAKRLFAARK